MVHWENGLFLTRPRLALDVRRRQPHGFVSHARYEHASLLRYAEDQFGLGRLAAADARANSPERDCFEMAQPPRAFVPFPAYAPRLAASPEPPDRQ